LDVLDGHPNTYLTAGIRRGTATKTHKTRDNLVTHLASLYVFSRAVQAD